MVERECMNQPLTKPRRLRGFPQTEGLSFARRYFAIVHPLCGRLSRWQTVATISIIWASSLLLSLPTLLYSSTRSYRYADGSVRTVCMLVWPDGQPHVSYADHV